jgi:hypothetical protein
VQVRTGNGWDEEVWVRPSSVRALSKQLGRNCDVKYMVALEHVMRACGFKDYQHAIKNPRKVLVPFDAWVAELTDAFAVDLERLFGRNGLKASYYKVFTDCRPVSLDTAASQTPPGTRPEERIPSRVSHEQTIVDSIAGYSHPPRRVAVRRG